MKSSHTYKTNEINKAIFIALLLCLVLVSGISTAQSTLPALLNPDSIQYTSRPENPKYIGYEMGFGTPVLSFQSNIPELNNLQVPFLGGKVGGVISNENGKVKAYAGLYYPGTTNPQDFDLIEGGLSASLYMLRIIKPKYHTIEPYLVVDLNYQVIRYYGTYMPEIPNSAKSNDMRLGNTRSTQLKIGTGFEFQLESDKNDFIHLFLDGGIGIPVGTNHSNEFFSETKPTNRLWVTIGLDLGKIK